MGETTGLVPYAHRDGTRLPVPAAWEPAEDPSPGITLVAVEPDHEGPGTSGFRANLVLTASELGDLDLDAWQAGSEPQLAASLADYRVLDLERLEVSGMPAIRRLAHHRGAGDVSVTLQQWSLVAGTGAQALGWTLAVTTATTDWPATTDAQAAIAAGWRVPGHGLGRPA